MPKQPSLGLQGTVDNERPLLKHVLAHYALWLVNKTSATSISQPIAIFQCLTIETIHWYSHISRSTETPYLWHKHGGPKANKTSNFALKAISFLS